MEEIIVWEKKIGKRRERDLKGKWKKATGWGIIVSQVNADIRNKNKGKNKREKKVRALPCEQKQCSDLFYSVSSLLTLCFAVPSVLSFPIFTFVWASFGPWELVLESFLLHLHIFLPAPHIFKNTFLKFVLCIV